MAKRCMAPSCYEIVRDGTARCDKHTQSKKKEVYINRKRIGRANSDIYDSARWKRISKKVRVLSGGLCVLCLKNNRTVYADVVDHIIPLSIDKTKAFDMKNLQPICHQCHATQTAEQVRKYKLK